MMADMTHLSLFSGIGGLDLAAEWAGFKTVGQCEWADYPTKVLEKHWPDVLRWRDIRTLTAEDFYARTGLRTVDIVSGGFPCQPFSVAGKQKGKGDDRYLWPEMLRVIRVLAPRWVVGENVPGILRIAADDICKDLEREGYDVGIFDYEAAAVKARHRRERIAFVANARSGGRSKSEIQGQQPRRTEAVRPSEAVADTEGERRGETRNGIERSEEWPSGCGTVADAKSIMRKEGLSSYESRVARFTNDGDLRIPASAGLPNGAVFQMGQSKQKQESQRSDWWATEPDVGRVAHGIPNRVDRLKCLGNAVVPQQFYPIFKAIASELALANK